MGLLDRLFNRAFSDEQIVIEEFEEFYNVVSLLSRAIDLIINSCAMVDYTIYRRNNGIYEVYPKPPKLQQLLWYPSTDIDNFSFYRKIFYDLMFKGNSLIYNRRVELQHIPNWKIVDDEIYAIIDNDRMKKLDKSNCVIVSCLGENGELGTPYITRIEEEKQLLSHIYSYLAQYFKNNSFLGIILKTERTLSDPLRKRLEKKFAEAFNMLRGKSFSPVILDGGVDVDRISAMLKDADITNILKSMKSSILEALGVPEILVKSGNNANITPNIKVFYYFTILPLCESLASAFSLQLKTLYRVTDGVVKPDLSNIPQLRADAKDEATAARQLYTAGICSRNEIRRKLGYQPLSEDIILVPVNIAGRNGVEAVEIDDNK